MANSKPKMDTNFRLRLGVSVLLIALVSVAEGAAPPKSKRQIYREQVLPSKGGKIPDDAFRSDRLALNRLNKEGIAIPDGVLLEHRKVHSHPHINKHDPEDEDSLVKIVQRPEDRYVSPEGKYHNSRPLTVASTYIIRKPIGPESSGIRPPLAQTAYHETHGNHINQFYPESYYPQQFLPTPIPQKYLPAELTAPPRKYLPVEPLSQKYLPVDTYAPPQKYLPPHKYAQITTPHANVVHHPHPYGYAPPVSYQQVHQSVAYYPIHVPLELPNKDTLKDEYYSVRNRENFGSHRTPEDIHGDISWPFLLKQYTRLSDKINVLDHDSYDQTPPHSLFFTPEVLGPIDSGSGYYSTRDRYARKSKEIAFTDGPPETDGKAPPKDSRRLIKLKCTAGSENAVEDGSAQCYIRY